MRSERKCSIFDLLWPDPSILEGESEKFVFLEKKNIFEEKKIHSHSCLTRVYLCAKLETIWIFYPCHKNFILVWFLHGCPLKCLSVHALLKDEIVATVGVRFSEGEISLLYPRKVDAGDADYKFNSIWKANKNIWRPCLLAIIGRWISTTTNLFYGSPHSPLVQGIFVELSHPCCPSQSIIPTSAVQTLVSLFGNNWLT